MASDNDRPGAAIPNPYIVGNPIDDRRMFFGREDDFSYIRNKIAGEKQGGLIVLCGARRSGKTSILFQIRRGRLGPDFVPVLIDMQSITVRGDDEFLFLLMGEVHAALDKAGVPGGGSPPKPRGSAKPAFGAFCETVTQRLAGRKLVVMFDEYELFETQILRDRFSTEVLNLMAGWIENCAGVFLVFTGSDKIEARSPEYWGHFLGKALHRRISFLSEADTLRLIEKPVSGHVVYDPGVPAMIHEMTAGQPFYTQVICQTIVDRLNETGSNRATRALLDAVVEEIIENPLPQMIFSWGSLAGIDKMALSIIAELSREGPRAVPPAGMLGFCKSEDLPLCPDPSSLQESLERLFHQDLLYKDADGGFRFKMDLWRVWVARMHSIWQVVDEVRSEDAAPGLRTKATIAARSRRRVQLVVLLALVGVLATVLLVAWRDWRSGDARRSVEAQPLSAMESDTTAAPAPPPVERPAPEPRYGSLRITSVPQGAAVILDGEPTGHTTPCTMDSLPGGALYRLELRLPGHKPGYLSAVRVVPDSAVSMHHRFEVAVHPLSVVSTPHGAEVRLDGELVGRTPVSLPEVTEGGHELLVELSGYQPHRQQILVPTPGPMIEVLLEKLPPGHLVLRIEPYADVWINGLLHEREVVTSRIELDAGEHRLELRHPVFGSRQMDVEIHSGRDTALRPTLSQENTGP